MAVSVGQEGLVRGTKVREWLDWVRNPNTHEHLTFSICCGSLKVSAGEDGPSCFVGVGVPV